MENQTLKQLAIGKCKTILKGPIKIYRFGNAYTIKDKISGDTLFELKAAEYCNPDDTQNESCECLIIKKQKLLIAQEGNELLAMVKNIFERQSAETQEI